MNGCVVIAALLISANAAVLPQSSVIDGRIVGGNSIDIASVPYQVALLFDRSGFGSFVHSCGGSIISPKAVVTAAHCTDGTRPALWKIRAGSNLHSDGGQVIQASRIIQHSRFNYAFDFDISLIFVNTEFLFGATIAKVTLPKQQDTIPDGSNVTVTGWGSVNDGGQQSTVLLKVHIPIVNHRKCIDIYSGFNKVTNNMICAGRMGVGGLGDACKGDDGGPLTFDGVLYGITSWGNGCAKTQYPRVWTRVSAFRNWINVNT